MQGIYKIENQITGRVYIGQSTNIVQRWYKHTTMLNNQWHFCSDLQRDWNELGKSKFSFSVIEECDSRSLLEREKYWIDVYGGIDSDKTYNIVDGENLMPQEVRDKISETLKGNVPWNKGLTAETDERVRCSQEKNRQKRMSVESRQHLSDVVRKKHERGDYNYEEMSRKRVETSKARGTVRKDKGTKRGPRDPEIGKRISKAKLEANARKRELGLPLRNQESKPTPMKTSICEVCGKAFEQRRCHYKKTCSMECRNKLIGLKRKGRK